MSPESILVKQGDWRLGGRHMAGGVLWALARLRHQYDKSYQRWYLPKLHYWLAFSLADTEREEMVPGHPSIAHGHGAFT
jgi:hypothetical protein